MASPQQQQFVQTYGPIAQDISKATGLDPSVVLGQIAQETGWGTHLAGGGSNAFGISKPGTDSPASYPSVGASGQAYVDLINRRYRDAALQSTPEAQARSIAAAGYNTNPAYAPAVADNAATVRSITQSQQASDDFNARWGISAPANDKAAPAAPASPPDESSFTQRWGVAPSATTATPSAAQTPAAAPTPAPTTAAAPTSSGPDYTGWDNPYGPPAPVDPNNRNPLTFGGLRNILAPAPNTIYGNVLPIATDTKTGQMRAALPMGMRDFAEGVVDLMQGPQTGQVTPRATMALAGLVPGLMASPAAHTGLPIALASREAPAAVEAPAAAPLTAPNPLATDRPAFIPPNAAAPSNPLAAQVTTPAANPLSNAPAAGSAAPAAAATPAALSAREAAEYAAIPESLPPAPKIPPLTQGSADARADQLIQHFAARNGAPPDQDLVPGFVPTLAQRTNDPGIATLERGVQAANPGALDLRKEANQAAIRDFTSSLVGTPEDIAAAQAERERVTAPMRDAAFANKTDVDASPIETSIQQTLAGPDGKRAAVRKTLNDVQASLHVGQDMDAPLETDPEQLYGVRKHINDLLSPAAQRDNPELQRAASSLSDVKNQLDDVIEAGAPGFKDYVSQYANLSRPIDEKQYLQGLNLTDQAGNVTGAKIDSALKAIAKQQNATGSNKAMSISDDTLNGLQKLRNTLQVARFSDTAGKPLGSNTFQNLATNSTVGAVAGNPLIHLGVTGMGSLVGGVPGALIGAGTQMAARGITNNAESMVRRAMIERLLNLQGKGEAALGGGARTP